MTDNLPRPQVKRWKAPSRRNSALLLLGGLAILLLAFALDTAGVSQPREEPSKGEITTKGDVK